jgi:hydroxymethylpyrimidine/phosphomethylpyrimidine kinase
MRPPLRACTSPGARGCPRPQHTAPGCTLSSAITALAAHTPAAGWLALVDGARDYLQWALEAGGELDVGSGPGPVHHFVGIWPEAFRSGQ